MNRQRSEPTFLRNIAFEFLSKPVTRRHEILESLGVSPDQHPDDAMREIARRGLIYEFAGKVRA